MVTNVNQENKFEGYVVDLKFKEFSKFNYRKKEVVPFESSKGVLMLTNCLAFYSKLLRQSVKRRKK